MSDREFRGKEEEKEYEKEEKEEEKEDEKSWGGGGYEKWRRDTLSSVVWAGMLIWAGLALLVWNMGFLARFESLGQWNLVFIGAGVIVLLEALVRLTVPTYRRAIGGTLLFAAILFGIGLGDIVGWNIIWALLLIAFGLSIVVRGLFRSS